MQLHTSTLRTTLLGLLLLLSFLPLANSNHYLVPATVEAKITLTALKALTALDRSIPEFKYQ